MPTIKQKLYIATDGQWFYNLRPFEPPGPREWKPSGLDVPGVDLGLAKLWEEVFDVTEGLEGIYVFAKRERGKKAGFVAVLRHVDLHRDIDKETLKQWRGCVRTFHKRVPLDIILRIYSLRRLGIEIPVESSEEALFAVDILEALIQECSGRT